MKKELEIFSTRYSCRNFKNENVGGKIKFPFGKIKLP